MMSILHVRAQTAIICSRSQSQSEVEAKQYVNLEPALKPMPSAAALNLTGP